MISVDKVSFANQCQFGNLSSLAKVCLQEWRRKKQKEIRNLGKRKQKKNWKFIVFEASLALLSFLISQTDLIFFHADSYF